MRVYLSSYLAGDRFGELRARSGARAAVVLNALDAFGESRDRDLGRELAAEGAAHDGFGALGDLLDHPRRPGRRPGGCAAYHP